MLSLKIKKSSLIELIIIILILTDTILLLSIIFYDFNKITIELIQYFDLIVCIILFSEYIYRINKTDDKKLFVKSNWIDLIAMLPDLLLNALLSVFGLSGVSGIVRLFRLVRVARVLILFRKNIKIFTQFIQESHLDKLLMVVVIVIISTSISFYMLEGLSFIDAIWYVIVTLTTVGYGDIVPTTTTGKIIGLILIFAGIIMFSTLTGAISSIYTKRIEKETRDEIDERLDCIEEKLDKLLKDNN